MIQLLLVEDETGLRTRFRKLLEETIGDCRVTGEAANGREAIQWLTTHSADAMITDIRMVEMDGLELIRRVRELDRDMPIVIVSGYSDFAYAREALRYGVSDYLLKPVDRKELAQVIGRLSKRLEEKRYPSETAAPANTGALAGPEGEERQIIKRVKEIIQIRLDQEISLQYLADQVHLNHRYLSTLFKTETGMNLFDYVTECRMEKARMLLRTTQLRVQEIAELSGYPNVKYFLSVFKQHAGVTPTDYRERGSRSAP
jgi:YesN/AraC family two-component response regulator